jgi:hypothetical protein
MANLEYDFVERMEAGRQVAMDRRNRGQPVGKPAKGWRYKRPDPVGLDRIEWEFESWRKEWQYQALAAVETALFAHEWEGL